MTVWRVWVMVRGVLRLCVHARGARVPLIKPIHHRPRALFDDAVHHAHRPNDDDDDRGFVNARVEHTIFLSPPSFNWI